MSELNGTNHTPELVDTDNRYYWKEIRGDAANLTSSLRELESGFKLCGVDPQPVAMARLQVEAAMDLLRRSLPDPIPDLSTLRATKSAAQTG